MSAERARRPTQHDPHTVVVEFQFLIFAGDRVREVIVVLVAAKDVVGGVCVVHDYIV